MGQFIRTRRPIIDWRGVGCDRPEGGGDASAACASLRGSRVSPSPYLWRQEGSRPDAALGGFRLVLLRAVIPATAVCQSLAPPHQPGVEVGSVRNEASR